MARIGTLYLAVSFALLATAGLYAQAPEETAPPPGPDPLALDPGHPRPPDRGERPRPDPNNPDKKEPGRRGEGMGKFGFGPGMGGPQFEKMVELALGPEKELADAIEKWPALQQKGPEAQARMLKQVENFRGFLRGQAMRDAEMLGIKIKPGQEDQFVRDYWKKKLEVDRTLRNEMEPRRRALMDQMNQELKKQFGS